MAMRHLLVVCGGTLTGFLLSADAEAMVKIGRKEPPAGQFLSGPRFHFDFNAARGLVRSLKTEIKDGDSRSSHGAWDFPDSCSSRVSPTFQGSLQQIAPQVSLISSQVPLNFNRFFLPSNSIFAIFILL